MNRNKVAETILFSVLFLFFLQALSDFIESIYAFGLLVTAFTIQVASILLLFTPLILIFLRKPPSRFVLIGIAYTAILARLIEPMLDAGGKLVACGISVGAFMLLFPLFLQRKTPVHGWQVGSGLLIALSLSVFFRTAGSSLDLSEAGIYQAISWLLGVIASIMIWDLDFVTEPEHGNISSSRHAIGLAIGLASVFLMMYFAFASPTVIARWTGFSYPMIVIVLVIAFTIFAVLFNPERTTRLPTRPLVLGWNAFFVITLVLTILPHQILFPAAPSVYPVGTPPASSLSILPLLLMLLSSPILLVDFMLYVRQTSAARPTLKQLGTSFSVAALFFLLIVFFHVFTSIYDYVPVIGPLFRDRFWLVYFLTGLGLFLPLWLIQKESFDFDNPSTTNLFTPITVGALAALSIIAVSITTPRPTPPQNSTQLKIMTYNIQQGFDIQGNKDLTGQLKNIQSVAPDVLGLQESDTARAANGNVDAVRYFADHLNMYSYYGPATTTGTFGIALLSKYPIQNPRTFFMYSKGEQTAAIQAEIVINGKTVEVFVTHLGNDGPIIQLENLLTQIKGLDRVVVMGDFNFEPTTDQYALMTGTLSDSWLMRWPGGKEIPGLEVNERIDYIFVSPQTKVFESEYVPNPASDHPYFYSVIQP